MALSQGGTYTTAIMLIADRYPAERRGAAVGWLIASSSAGYALSLLLSAPALAWGGYETAFLVSACGPVVGVVVLWFALRATPNVVHPPRAGVRFGAAVLRNRPAMRLIFGYTFHSWELLGMWAWTPAFVAAVFAATGAGAIRAVELAAYLSAAFHLTGLVASFSMGRLSDRLGRKVVLFGLAATSAGCSLVFGWLVAAPVAVVFPSGRSTASPRSAIRPSCRPRSPRPWAPPTSARRSRFDRSSASAPAPSRPSCLAGSST